MSDMDWRSLQYFRAVVSSGSILGAAKALNVTATTVRSSLDRFEDQIGARLLRRTHGGIKLTSAGEEVYKKILEASSTIDQIATTEEGTNDLLPNCRVSCSVIFFRTILAERIDVLAQIEDKLHFLIEPTDTVRNLSDEEIDISIRHRRPVQESFISINAGSLKLTLFAPLSAKDLNHALLNYPYLTTPSEREYASSIDREHIYNQIKWPVTFRSYGHLADAMQHGRCVGILPEIIGNRLTHLKKIAPAFKPVEVPVWICRKRTTTNHRRIQRGFRVLRSVITEALADETKTGSDDRTST